MIKALFFDLDGTLLNDDKKISRQTRLTLEKCKENGIKLFIATGRPPLLDLMLGWDNQTLSLFDGGLYHNGGCIEIGEWKEYSPIDDKIVGGAVKIVNGCESLNIALQLENELHAFRFPLDERAYKLWGLNPAMCFGLNHVNNLRTIKILIFYGNFIDTVKNIENDLVSSIETLCKNKAWFYVDRGLFIVITSVNKFEGVEKIRKKLNLAKDEIVVFGDDVNDIEMLAAYPNSFAMGNAENHIKEAAK